MLSWVFEVFQLLISSVDYSQSRVYFPPQLRLHIYPFKMLKTVEKMNEGCEFIFVNVCILSQISSVRGYEEEAKIAYATLLDIEGQTEEAISTLENISNLSSIWHLAQVSHRLLHILHYAISDLCV